MLSNQLLSRAEVSRLVANHALLAGHQHVKEVVDHDRHLDAINRGEHAPILRQQPTRPNEAQNRSATTDSDACSPALQKVGQGRTALADTQAPRRAIAECPLRVEAAAKPEGRVPV